MTQGWDLGVLGGSNLQREDLRWHTIDCAFWFQFVLNVYSDISKGHNFVTNLRTMTGYKLKLDLVNINSHTKFVFLQY